MKANYHTHTYRCHHGFGCEWECVEEAIAKGLEELGFSEHAPFAYPGYRSFYHMEPEQTADYLETVRWLQKQYAGKIKIFCGFESEYYPELMGPIYDLLDDPDSGLQYMILGQHHLKNEYDGGWRESQPFDSEILLAEYVDQVIAGMETGRFLYLCHPDTPNFVGPDDIYYKHMKRLCQAAKHFDMPLELNGQGWRHGRYYPGDRFFAIAGEVGNTAIIGSDAHRPQNVWPEEVIAALTAMADRHHLQLIDRLEELV